MRILQIINDLSSGGAEKLVADVVPIMKDMGHEVEILLLRRESSVYNEDLEEKGIKISYLSNNRLFSFFHVHFIRRFINEGKFDIVNVHIFPALYYVGLSSILGLRGVKLCYTEHSTHNRRRNNNFFKIIDKFIYKLYDIVIAIAYDAKKKLVSHIECDSDFVSIINNGVDIDKFKNSAAINLFELIEGYDPQDKIICMVSRFNEAKDQSTLIKAVSLLSKDIKLLLVGEGFQNSICITLSEDLNIQDRVFFLGFRKDIPMILKASDIGVLSSNWEGMPLFALEVFASGIPFIGSKVPGIKDLFLHENDSEILFKHKDSKALSLLIKKLLEDKASKNRNKEICQKTISNYSLKRMTNSYLELYSKLLTS